MARGDHHHPLLLVAVVLAGVVACVQAGTPLDLSDAQCFGDPANRAANEAIATSCGDLAATTDSNGDLAFDCSSACGDAFSMLTRSCRNSVASAEGIGFSYRIIFDSCGVDYTDSSGGSIPGSSAPGSGGSDADAFSYLDTAANQQAGQRFLASCSDLMPTADSSADGGVSIDCPAECSAALKEITQGCIDSIASDADLGQIYQLVFNECDVPFVANDGTAGDSNDDSGAATPSVSEPSDDDTTPDGDAPGAESPQPSAAAVPDNAEEPSERDDAPTTDAPAADGPAADNPSPGSAADTPDPTTEVGATRAPSATPMAAPTSSATATPTAALAPSATATPTAAPAPQAALRTAGGIPSAAMAAAISGALLALLA